jgi:periplasmic protein TonB
MMTMRFGLALAASLALHLAVLLPVEWWLPRVPAPSLPPLAVMLPPPEMAREIATQQERLQSPANAVSPAPTFQKEVPKALTGRALNTALAALTREEFYPREAIARGLEGRVVLLLTLDTAGTVTALEVASSSGHPMLDGAALKAAMRIGSLPGGRRQVLLPVEFRLE